MYICLLLFRFYSCCHCRRTHSSRWRSTRVRHVSARMASHPSRGSSKTSRGVSGYGPPLPSWGWASLIPTCFTSLSRQASALFGGRLKSPISSAVSPCQMIHLRNFVLCKQKYFLPWSRSSAIQYFYVSMELHEYSCSYLRLKSIQRKTGNIFM